jgi:biotin synthase
MNVRAVDTNNQERIATFGRRVLAGNDLSQEDALWLFELEERADILDLMSWANRVREYFKGNKIHLCSIVNVKAGGCSENCKFCAQSAFYETESPQHDLLEREAVLRAVEEIGRAHV